MQRTLHLCLSLFASTALLAQATDFTLDDCAGTSHHLFDELDQGKIVILEFAMIPTCSPCILAGTAIQGVMDNFAASNPGVVKWYTWGGVDAYTCSQMDAWEASHDFYPTATMIDGSSMANNYGGFSMPTIVVLAGSDHEVILEQHGYIGATGSNITNAIYAELALGIQDLPDPVVSVTLMPNPASTSLKVSMELPSGTDVAFTVYDATGREVRSLEAQPFSAGQQVATIAVGDLMNGRYILGVSGTFATQMVPFQVIH